MNSEQAKQNSAPKTSVYRNNKYEINLTHATLSSQCLDKPNAGIFKFRGDKSETSNQTMKMLVKTMKRSKQVRKVDINCRR